MREAAPKKFEDIWQWLEQLLLDSQLSGRTGESPKQQRRVSWVPWSSRLPRMGLRHGRLEKQTEVKSRAFEMWCLRKMLRISWKEHKTNEFVRCQVGEYTPLYHKIVRNKLQYFGHISRREGDCLEKIIVQGMMEGQRRRGSRQKTRWTDGIKESTGLSVTAAYRIAQDRHSWNDIIKRVTTSQPWLIGQRRRLFKIWTAHNHIIYIKIW